MATETRKTEVVDLQEKETGRKEAGRAATKRHATGRRTPFSGILVTADQRCENAKLGQLPALSPV